MEEGRKITQEQGLDYAQKHGMKYYETSAKTGFNLHETFMTMSRDIISKI